MDQQHNCYRPTAMPKLNKPAPDFNAVTTHGVKTLADYAGKWLVLFSHPADFTPVCTTEFIAFAKRHDKFLRLVTALQTSDANGIATPEGWQPGDKVIVPPPATADAAEARINEGYECTDWYFCTKEL